MSEADERLEAEIIRRINDDDELSDEEWQKLLDDLAVVQFFNTGSVS